MVLDPADCDTELFPFRLMRPVIAQVFPVKLVSTMTPDNVSVVAATPLTNVNAVVTFPVKVAEGAELICDWLDEYPVVS